MTVPKLLGAEMEDRAVTVAQLMIRLWKGDGR